jgi:OPA family glycerol-3-phosphate transporter-like MFS transporter
MSLSIVCICLAVVIGIYFYNNPLNHGPWFLSRRFINWFPLGMTYAFLYMGRYNLTVAKNALGSLMSNEDFGLIFAAGTVTYAFSFLINGPLVDRIGGKKGILIAACGAALANIALGVITWLVLTGRLHVRLLGIFSVTYALNMYFQSYGAVSIIKVKAYWFHVRERGVFGAIFGTLISLGVYFAFDWGQAVINMTKVNAPAYRNAIVSFIRSIFLSPGQTIDATWAVFYIPAAILVAWAVLDLWLIKDTPELAGFPHLETHDASSGHMHEEYTTLDLLKKVFLNPLMLMFAFIELTAGVLRNGIMQWYTIFAHEVKQTGAEIIVGNWGLLLCVFGIVGGFASGLISDKFFQSRRGPPAMIFCAFMLMMAAVMAMNLFSMPLIVGIAALLIVAAVTGVHSLMSGTAAADFGGRKATATCSGIVDGFVYLGSGVQSVGVGYLVTHYSWQWWPVFLMPFALIGGLIAWNIWHELPAATRAYIEKVERKHPPMPQLGQQTQLTTP